MASFELIQISKLDPNPKNIRLDVGDVSELADSITAQGILQPLTVAPHPTAKTKFVLLAGHRRLAAAKLAKLKTVPCMIREDLASEQAQLEAMIVENLQRADLTITEEAAAYQQLLTFPDYTEQRISKQTGRSLKTVKQRLQINRLNDEAKSSLNSHQLTVDQALELAPFADDAAATARLLKVADKPNDWKFNLTRETERSEWEQGLPKLLEELSAAGIPVIDRPKGQEWEWTEWRRIYSAPDVEEAAAAGLSAICSQTATGIMWVKPKETKASQVQEATPEELAAQQNRNRINADLKTVAGVRQSWIRDLIRKPPAGLAQKALADLAGDMNTEALAGWLGIEIEEETDEQEVIDAIGKLSADQLAVLIHVERNARETNMEQLGGWSPNTGYGSAVDWRDCLAMYGYEYTEPERDALTWHEEQRKAVAARNAEQAA